jgi:hypothetical protein
MITNLRRCLQACSYIIRFITAYAASVLPPWGGQPPHVDSRRVTCHSRITDAVTSFNWSESIPHIDGVTYTSSDAHKAGSTTPVHSLRNAILDVFYSRHNGMKLMASCSVLRSVIVPCRLLQRPTIHGIQILGLSIA